MQVTYQWVLDICTIMWYKDQAAMRWTHFRVINWKSLNKSEMSHQRKGGEGMNRNQLSYFRYNKTEL